MTPPRVIDAHHHLWDLSVRDQEWLKGNELAPLRKDFTAHQFEGEAVAAAVEASVLVQTVTLPEETTELLAIAAASDVIVGVVGWTDLTAPDVADALSVLQEGPGGGYLVGIRHQVQSEPDSDWLLRPDVQRGLQAVAAAGLVYDLVIHVHQLPAAISAAARLPGLTFVLDHLGKPPVATGPIQPWADQLHTLASRPNTVCKLSGLVTEADWRTWTHDDLRPYVDVALDAFGPDRLMFGSDWPVCTLAATYREVLAAARELTCHLSSQGQDAVLGGTAARVYGV